MDQIRIDESAQNSALKGRYDEDEAGEKVNGRGERMVDR